MHKVTPLSWILLSVLISLISACNQLERQPANNPVITGTRVVPAPVVGLGANVLKISAGDYFTCALVAASASNNQVYCWGANDSGQLGNGSNTPSPSPVQVQGLVNVVDVSAGNGFACAIDNVSTDTPNQVKCWGNNNGSQLGRSDGSTNNSNFPVPVAATVIPTTPTTPVTPQQPPATPATPKPPPTASAADTTATFTGAKAIFASNYSRVCAVGPDNKAYCWGLIIQQTAQSTGGTNPTINYVASVVTAAVPTAIVPVDPSARPWTGVTSMALVQADSCAVVGGVAVCLGQSIANPTAATIVGGDTYTCQINSADQTQSLCWPVTPTTSATKPTTFLITYDYPITQASAFSGHTCAVASSQGEIWCFGLNNRGQLGFGYTSSVPTIPQNRSQVSGMVNPFSVSTGFLHTCAISLAGTTNGVPVGAAWCWGANDNGQLGLGVINHFAKPSERPNRKR